MGSVAMHDTVSRRTVMKSIGAAGAVGLAGCSTDGGSSGNTISMGILMGVTGGLSEVGPAIRDAAELAVKQVRDADNGFSVDTQFENTETKPSRGVSGAEALVNGGYPMICGGLASSVTLQVAENVAIPNQTVMCSPSATSPDVSTLEDNDFVYRTPPTDKLQGSLLAQIAAERLEKESAAILFLNNAYGNGLSNGFTKTFEEEYGGEVLNQVSYSAGRSSYTSQLQNALDGDPETLVIIGYPESGNKIFRNFYGNFDRADMDILVPDGLRADDLPGNVGHDMTNVRGTNPSSAGPGIEYFRSAYEEEYGSAPGPFNQQSFDAAAVLMLARAAAGEAAGTAIRDQMRAVTDPGGETVGPENLGEGVSLAADGNEINYQGVSGPVEFDDNGDLASAVYNYFRYTEDGTENIEQVQV
ncbi:branched-chain amino acid ABC transporter substrate-binding protein [Haloarcula sebkhae]|uniref:Branched-chain amino acid ABC transporter substrate-binding protein n=2 Tax=Haloarcula sebkhae TaxID=932660 RepID=A0A830F5K5_9EURY|nr:branched-chain amino acid ABC transporter substrate-binding protein [Haloarcula sebkhae]